MRRKNIYIRIMQKAPPLILDQRWHALFSKNKPRKLKFLEDKLTKLLKAQGQSNIDYKEYQQLKKKVMGDILETMPEAFNEEEPSSLHSMEVNKRYIEDINSKIEKLESLVSKLPKEIEEVNSELLNVSMSLCYDRMLEKKEDLEMMESRIQSLREEIKDLMVRRNEKKEEYEQLYGYMHDMVGPKIIEQFDKMYLGG